MRTRYTKESKKTHKSGSGAMSHRNRWIIEKFSFLHKFVNPKGGRSLPSVSTNCLGQIILHISEIMYIFIEIQNSKNGVKKLNLFESVLVFYSILLNLPCFFSYFHRRCLIDPRPAAQNYSNYRWMRLKRTKICYLLLRITPAKFEGVYII